MKYSDQSYNMRIELDTENCELSAAQTEQLEEALPPLREPVGDFPTADLYITIQYKPTSLEYRIKAVLRLPGKGLATGDLDEEMYPAFRRCVSKLVHKVTAYQDRLEDAEAIAKHEKRTRHAVVARRPVDAQALQEAVGKGNYVAFRKLTYPFEEPVRNSNLDFFRRRACGGGRSF